MTDQQAEEWKEAWLAQWQSQWGSYEQHPSLILPDEFIHKAVEQYGQRLMGNYPFFHPRYAGQMLKPPHPIAQLGYAMAMAINPNNHALDGGPPTSEMEKEIIRQFAGMVGFPADALGHLTAGGTIANLEALWIARCLHPDKAIAFSEAAHYTHERMCGVLGIEWLRIPCNERGVMDMQALEREVAKGKIGTVVLTAGTTGLGKVEAIDRALELKKKYGLRIHVDAAYGGFFVLLAGKYECLAPFTAIAECDSVVIDPHKHGMQPYGCGCVMFPDTSVGHFYKHDSPYTYFSSDELHLGEISLECSRAGAAAGALWLTLQCFPLQADSGFGPVLDACLRASRRWAELLRSDSLWRLYTEPELDILAYFPDARTSSEIDRLSQAVFEEAMNRRPEPLFLSVYTVQTEKLCALHPHIQADTSHTRILRSVLMKPEHEYYVEHLHQELSAIVRSQLRAPYML